MAMGEIEISHPVVGIGSGEGSRHVDMHLKSQVYDGRDEQLLRALWLVRLVESAGSRYSNRTCLKPIHIKIERLSTNLNKKCWSGMEKDAKVPPWPFIHVHTHEKGRLNI